MHLCKIQLLLALQVLSSELIYITSLTQKIYKKLKNENKHAIAAQ